MTWDLTWRKHFLHDDEYIWMARTSNQATQPVSLQKYPPRTFVDLLWMADPAPWPASRVFQRHVAWRPARSLGNRCVMVKVEDSRRLWSTFDVFFAFFFVHVFGICVWEMMENDGKWRIIFVSWPSFFDGQVVPPKLGISVTWGT